MQIKIILCEIYLRRISPITA